MLLLRHLHRFFSPEAFDAFMVDCPSQTTEFAVNTRAAKPGPPAGNPPHLPEQLPLVGRATLDVTLRRAGMPQRATGTTLRYLLRPQTATDFAGGPSTPLGAYQFPFAASFRISMSRAWFATSFFRSAFSSARSEDGKG